jgi:dolichol kinase
VETEAMLRKLFHLSGIIIPVAYLLMNKGAARVATALLFVAMGLFELLRIKGILEIDIVRRYTKYKEKGRPLGSFYYVLSALIVILLFDKGIAVASLFTLSISDPLSSAIGSRFGRIHILQKTLEGTLTFFLSAFGIFLLFSFGFYTALTTAAISAATELLSGRFIDDNLSIPVVTASALTVLSKL